MRFADWLRGVATTALEDVQKVINTASAAVNASPLPAPVKLLANELLVGANAGLTALEGVAGGITGEAIADGVDDVTTLLMNTATNIGNAKSPADFSKAELATLHQTWMAMKAQGDTLMAQFLAGLDPVKAAVEAAAAKTPPAPQ